jgi:hypothetical protein
LTLRKIDQAFLENFEICRRGLEKIIWNDRVRNEEVLLGDKVVKNILQSRKRRKANWVGHILRKEQPSKTLY